MNETSGAQNIIEVRDLRKSYGAVTAVDGISFDVRRGELFTFLGLNGAGKSTTINILCSILKKDSGNVFVDGLDLDKDSGAIKQKIGIVFQGSVLDGKLSVEDNLKSRAALYRMDKRQRRERIGTVTELLNLEDILKRRYDRLSGGQRRRVDIARALLHEPDILFLDEPTTGLDPNTRISVWQTVENLVKEKGLTVFLTTHYMEEVTRADSVIILDAGRIAARGTPDSLKAEYTTDFLRLLLPRGEEAEAVFSKEGLSFTYKNNSYYAEFPSCTKARDFLSGHPEFTDFEILKGDMDDVFLNVTGKDISGTEEP